MSIASLRTSVRDRRHGALRSVRRLRSKRVLVALLAAMTLLAGCAVDPGYQGRSSVEWMRALRDEDPETRAAAASALGHVLALRPDFPAVVDALISALADSSDNVRLVAANALVTDGVKSPGAIPGVVAALSDSAHPFVRLQAAVLLSYFGRSATDAIPALTLALRDPEAEVRAAAAETLGKIATASLPLMVALVELSRDPSPSARVKALEAIMNIESPPAQSVPVFTRALRDSSSVVRTVAAYALGSLKTEAVPAIDALRGGLADSSPRVRAAVAFALGEIGPCAISARPVLSILAKSDTSSDVRARAAEALAGVDGRPRPRVRPSEPSMLEKCTSPTGRVDRRC